MFTLAYLHQRVGSLSVKALILPVCVVQDCHSPPASLALDLKSVMLASDDSSCPKAHLAEVATEVFCI